jgi:hypothetical protein
MYNGEHNHQTDQANAVNSHNWPGAHFSNFDSTSIYAIHFGITSQVKNTAKPTEQHYELQSADMPYPNTVHVATHFSL